MRHGLELLKTCSQMSLMGSSAEIQTDIRIAPEEGSKIEIINCNYFHLRAGGVGDGGVEGEIKTCKD